MHQSSFALKVIVMTFPSELKMRYRLSLKELGNNARNTAFFLLFNAVDSVTSNTSAEGQQVHDVIVKRAVHSLWDVIDDTRLETNVAVVQQEGGHGGVKDAGGRTGQRATNQW